MSYDKIDRTKDNAEYAAAGIKKAEENGMADIKATEQKLKADTENRVDHVKANETADVARLNVALSEKPSGKAEGAPLALSPGFALLTWLMMGQCLETGSLKR